MRSMKKRRPPGSATRPRRRRPVRRGAEQHLARGAGAGEAAQPRFRVPAGRVGRPVHLDEGRVAADEGAQQPARAADGAHAKVVARQVPGRERALGGAVKLGNRLDAEAVLEALPDVGPQAVAKGDAHGVGLVEVGARDGVLLGRRGEEVAERLADVLDHGGVGGAHLGPKRLGRELAAEREGAPAHDGGAEAEHGGGGVVEWHTLTPRFSQ
ncbi:hypothetical protein BBAD15_g8520 [Beauveria bassiana D1-5]|uniref:Uncharacterized protein n=1 Tax=Beauveria bassiana D1-5 TaxID=1245745 RepID=A0A0A2VF63_BEABA|nr:hypothetical protein BBAD15_g8520 [Beauveria bassiana D1-5]